VAPALPRASVSALAPLVPKASVEWMILKTGKPVAFGGTDPVLTQLGNPWLFRFRPNDSFWSRATVAPALPRASVSALAPLVPKASVEWMIAHPT
jgi:hypothetical protein